MCHVVHIQGISTKFVPTSGPLHMWYFIFSLPFQLILMSWWWRRETFLTIVFKVDVPVSHGGHRCDVPPRHFSRKDLTHMLGELSADIFQKSAPSGIVSALESHRLQMWPTSNNWSMQEHKGLTVQPNLEEIRRVIPVLELPTDWISCSLFSLPRVHAPEHSLISTLYAQLWLRILFPAGHNLQHSPSQISYLVILYLRLLVVSSTQKVLYLLIKLLFTYFSRRI